MTNPPPKHDYRLDQSIKYFMDLDGWIWRGPVPGSLRYSKFEGFTKTKESREIWTLSRYDQPEESREITEGQAAECIAALRLADIGYLQPPPEKAQFYWESPWGDVYVAEMHDCRDGLHTTCKIKVPELVEHPFLTHVKRLHSMDPVIYGEKEQVWHPRQRDAETRSPRLRDDPFFNRLVGLVCGALMAWAWVKCGPFS